MVAEIARAQKLDVTRTMARRVEITAAVGDHKRWFNHYRSRFLMLDLFPQNRESLSSLVRGLRRASCAMMTNPKPPCE